MSVGGELGATTALPRSSSLPSGRAALGPRTLFLTGCVFAVVLLVPNVVWIARDRTVWPWDPSWYGEVSVDLWAVLRHDPSAWPRAMASAFGMKPPAIAWLGQFAIPLRNVLGAENAMLLSVVLSQAVALVLLGYATLRLTARRGPAAIAVLALAGAPLFVQLGHEYFPESLQALAAAWTLLIMASARSWRLALTLTQLSAALAFGLLVKLTTPLYVGLPALAAVVLALTGERVPLGPAWRDRRVVASGFLAVLFGVGAAGWYSRNISAAIAHARDAQTSPLYGVNTSLIGRISSWSSRLLDAAFLPRFPLLVISVLGLALVAYVLRLRRSGTRTRFEISPLRLAALLATSGTVVLTIAAFSSARPQDPRYLLAAVPSLAVIVALAVNSLGKPLVVASILGLLALQYTLVVGQSLGGFTVSDLTYAGLQPPQPSGQFSNTLRAIVRATCNTESANRINMVGVDYPWLNANVLEMYAAEQFRVAGRACYYTPLGYAQTDANAAWDRLQQFKPPYFIDIDYRNPSNRLPVQLSRLIYPADPFNVINRTIFRRVAKSDLFRPMPGYRTNGLVVFEAPKNFVSH
jgi:Dolichyl-phosphate-mannose-protein mannosyltransferase